MFKALAVAAGYQDSGGSANGLTYYWNLPDGTQKYVAEASFAYSRAEEPTTAASSQIAETIRQKVNALGYSVASVTFLTSDLASPDVVVSVPDPTAFFNDPPTVTSLIGPVDGYEAWELTIEGPDGQVAAVSTYSAATGISMAWRDPAYGSASPNGPPVQSQNGSSG